MNAEPGTQEFNDALGAAEEIRDGSAMEDIDYQLDEDDEGDDDGKGGEAPGAAFPASPASVQPVQVLTVLLQGRTFEVQAHAMTVQGGRHDATVHRQGRRFA